jgi:hypothetical protein
MLQMLQMPQMLQMLQMLGFSVDPDPAFYLSTESDLDPSFAVTLKNKFYGSFSFL